MTCNISFFKAWLTIEDGVILLILVYNFDSGLYEHGFISVVINFGSTLWKG